jgi:predicted Zn-dependent protease
LSEILIENNIRTNYAEKLLKPLENHYRLNPNYYRLMSKLYAEKNSIFKSNVYLSEYYVLLDNIDLSIDVLSNAINSNKTSSSEKIRLGEKRTALICRYKRPLEPIFGEKTCN